VESSIQFLTEAITMNLGSIISKVSAVSKVQEFLKGLTFPLNKQEILAKARDSKLDDNSRSMLEKIPDKQYPNQSEVVNELTKTG
jgi:hypothetical protein